MVMLDEGRLLDTSRKMHYGDAGVPYVRGRVEQALDSGELGTGDRAGPRLATLYASLGRQGAVEALGLWRPKELDIVAEYFDVRLQALSTKDTEDADARAATRQIVRAREEQGAYPQYDEQAVLDLVRIKVGPRSKLSAGHLRQILDVARRELELAPTAESDEALQGAVSALIDDVGLQEASGRLGFTGSGASGAKDLYYLRCFLGLHEMGEFQGSKSFVPRMAGERRDFDAYRRQGD